MNEDFGLPASTESAPEGAERKWVDAGERQAARLANVPAIYKTTRERLACELMLGMEEPDKIFADYGFSPEQSLALTEEAEFTALCTRIGTEIRETGLSFKSKMKAIAEDLIPYAHELATDPLAPAAVRQKIMEWAARLAGFEPPPAKGVVGEGGGGFNLSITFAGQPPQQVLAEGRTLEHQT